MKFSFYITSGNSDFEVVQSVVPRQSQNGFHLRLDNTQPDSSPSTSISTTAQINSTRDNEVFGLLEHGAVTLEVIILLTFSQQIGLTLSIRVA